MAAERAVIQPEPNEWDKKVPCSFKHLQSYNAREIIQKNLIHYFKWTNFNEILHETNRSEHSFECTREEASSIRDNLHLILTSAHTNIWFIINTYPLHKLHEQWFSDKRIIRHQPSKVLFSFGSMYSTQLFYNHTKQFHHTGTIKVWMQGSRAISLIISIRSSNKNIIIPIQSIQKTLLVNKGHEDQPIQIILMLNSAVRIYETDINTKSDTRIVNDEVPNSLTDILSKSSELLLQFDPPVNAWSFLLALPIIGHTDNNKRQDGNFQINFALFASEDWSITNLTVKHNFNSFKSKYSIEMLQSLGYVFTDKYMKSPDIEKSFKKIEQCSINKFNDFCSSLYNALRKDHCLSLEEFIKCNTPAIMKTDSTIITMTETNNRFVFVRHITLTPMRVIFKPLCQEIGNRALLLRGVENYIRVHIREENDDTLDILDTTVRSRFKSKMLTSGIMCMNRTYYCVGSSTSQMKSGSYWFAALNDGETIEQVPAQFGDFTKIKNVATHVARIGLYFSTSTATNIRLKYIEPSEITIKIQEPTPFNSFSLSDGLWSRISSWLKKPADTNVFQQKYVAHSIRDIEENGFCFTDGCGLISLGLAQEVAERIGLPVKQLSDIPSVFQIRIAGCKGILMIDPESTHDDFYIKIRDSMVKFVSNDWTLHICAYSRRMPLSLNNQIIRLLNDLGNPLAVFESLQNRMSKPALWHAPEDACLDIFDSELVQYQQSRYLNVKENLLRNKIPLPTDEARNMFGVADVTGTLKYGQCFIQYQVGTQEKKTYKVLKGTVLVTKNPCLHPGDFRKLQAVDVPALRHCVRDVIVFPTTGPRPHSDEISGSDLDGDQYWVYWGDDLKINKPVDALAHSSATKSVVAEITNEMIIDYFLDTIDHNCYSIIADVHTVVADKAEQGTLSKECLELATLFYRAIDSPKTGEIIDMSRVIQLKNQFCDKFPKCMMKFDQPYYESTSIIEKLFLKTKSITNKITRKELYEKYQVSNFVREKVSISTATASNSDLERIQPSFLYKYFLLLAHSIGTSGWKSFLLNK